MAQKIFWNWQDDDSTKDLNFRDAWNEPGRYRGYDGDLSGVGGNILRLKSDGITAAVLTDFDTPNYTVVKRSVALTKQKVAIHEDDDIDIPFVANNSGNPRIDIVILTHTYVDVPNASIGIYTLVQGVPSTTPVAPPIPAPDQISIIIGELYVPDGSNDITDPGIIWTQSASPNYNAIPLPPNIEYLDQAQWNTGTKGFSLLLQDMNQATISGSTLNFTGSKKSNLYYLNFLGSEIAINNFNFPADESGVGNIGFVCKVVTAQALAIAQGGSISLPHITTLNGATPTLHVKVGETFEIWRVQLISGYNYVVFRGGEFNINSYNQLRSALSPAVTTSNFSLSPGTPTDVSFEANHHFLNGNTTNNGQLNSIQASPTGEGTIFTIRVRRTSPTPGTFTLVHNSGSVPSGYKPLLLPSGANVTNISGLGDTTLVFVEILSGWALVGWYDVTGEINNSIFPKDESPKLIGTAGTMQNGEAIPTYISGAVSGNVSLFMTTQGKVRIIGNVEIAATSGSNLYAIFNLPTGYRPVVDITGAMPMAAVGGITVTVQMAIAASNGAVILATDNSTTNTLNGYFDLELIPV